jgi:23S rRNA (adenine2503-C2)-methyltransferase
MSSRSSFGGVVMSKLFDYKVFNSSEGNVFKYVFTWEDAVAEAVLYKYGDFYERTVICCSTQSGCPVGCKFCGTGNKFVRDLTDVEIVQQISTILMNKAITDVSEKSKRFQIMFMSMGEPLLNWDNVEKAIRKLHHLHPNAELLISTIAPRTDDYGKLIALSKEIDKVGLQFSIHKSNNLDRDKLIPYENKLRLQEIRDFGILWWKETGRHPYLNYCVDGTNDMFYDFTSLRDLFSPLVFNFTFSVVCSANETMKDAGFKNLEIIRTFEQHFIDEGYNTRIFNPDGQDDIGGGCGQLWYVQQWMKEHSKGD